MRSLSYNWPWFQLACYKNLTTTCEFFLPTLHRYWIAPFFFSFPNLTNFSFKLEFDLYNSRLDHGDARLDRIYTSSSRLKPTSSLTEEEKKCLFNNSIHFASHRDTGPRIIYSSLKLLICSINAKRKKERKKERERESVARGTSVPFSLLSAR